MAKPDEFNIDDPREIGKKKRRVDRRTLNQIAAFVKDDDATEEVVTIEEIVGESTLVMESLGPQDDPDRPLAKSYVQYTLSGDTFRPAGPIALAPKLGRHAYRISEDMGGVKFTRARAKTDELYMFKDSAMHRVLEEIDKFWDLPEDYHKLGVLHNRGVLLEGPPGTGKSSLIQQVAEMMVKRGDVVFFSQRVGPVISALNQFREIEPNRNVVVILEDADEHVKYEQNKFLQLLDGDLAVEGVLYLATTNYIENFPPRLLRPGRFDKIVHVGAPPIEGRQVYLQHKLADIETEEGIKDLAEKTDGFSFGHLRELVVSIYALKEPKDRTIERLRSGTPVRSECWDPEQKEAYESMITTVLNAGPNGPTGPTGGVGDIGTSPGPVGPPGVEGVDGIDDVSEHTTDEEKFTADVARLFKKKKKSLGIKSVRQNYKGTGSKSADRQLWVRFKGAAVIDLWIYPDRIQYGGVVANDTKGKSRFPDARGMVVGNKSAQQVVDQIDKDLSAWLSDDATESVPVPMLESLARVRQQAIFEEVGKSWNEDFDIGALLDRGVKYVRELTSVANLNIDQLSSAPGGRKRNKSEVSYRATTVPTNETKAQHATRAHCGTCRFFLGDAKKCKLVEGDIKHDDTCNLWTPKAQMKTFGEAGELDRRASLIQWNVSSYGTWVAGLKVGDPIMARWTSGSFGHNEGMATVSKVNAKSVRATLDTDIDSDYGGWKAGQTLNILTDSISKKWAFFNGAFPVDGPKAFSPGGSKYVDGRLVKADKEIRLVSTWKDADQATIVADNLFDDGHAKVYADEDNPTIVMVELTSDKLKSVEDWLRTQNPRPVSVAHEAAGDKVWMKSKVKRGFKIGSVRLKSGDTMYSIASAHTPKAPGGYLKENRDGSLEIIEFEEAHKTEAQWFPHISTPRRSKRNWFEIEAKEKDQLSDDLGETFKETFFAPNKGGATPNSATTTMKELGEEIDEVLETYNLGIGGRGRLLGTSETVSSFWNDKFKKGEFELDDQGGGRVLIPLTREALEDQLGEIIPSGQIENTALTITWHKMESGNWEIIGHLSISST